MKSFVCVEPDGSTFSNVSIGAFPPQGTIQTHTLNEQSSNNVGRPRRTAKFYATFSSINEV